MRLTRRKERVGTGRQVILVWLHVGGGEKREEVARTRLFMYCAWARTFLRSIRRETADSLPGSCWQSRGALFARRLCSRSRIVAASDSTGCRLLLIADLSRAVRAVRIKVGWAVAWRATVTGPDALIERVFAGVSNWSAVDVPALNAQ